MQRFTSKLLEPFHDLRARISPPRPRTPTTDRDNDETAHRRAQSGVTGRRAPKKPSARQRLDGLGSFRIHDSAITFIPGGSSGSGGKADVVRATFRLDTGNEEQVVAVKKLRSHGGINQKKFSNEFVHEVEITAGLSHDNIVKLVGFVEDLENGKAWIVLSWAPNGNVSDFLATGTWEIPERVSLIKDTFEGVRYLHTRQPPICHGDLKSLNILVSSSYRAIITDFGSARAITESEDGVIDQELDQQAQQNPTPEQPSPQIQVGAVGNQLTLTGPAWSLRWAPPEVVDGKRPSLSTDIWAGGWICWEVMTDKVPFHEVNSAGVITLMVIQGEVPEAREDAQLAQIIRLCSLMKDCWAFDPRTRPKISRCCTELYWIPSVLPFGGKASDRKVPSIELLLEMGLMHYKQASPENATSLFQEALSLARSAGNQTATARALEYLGDVYQFQCKYTQAEESYARAQELYARVGDDRGRAYTLHGLGNLYYHQSKYTQAEESFTRVQETFARIGDAQGRANTLLGLGHIYRIQSKYTEAEESYTRAQEIYARTGDERGRANTLRGQGHVFNDQSKYTQAAESYTRAQEIYARIGDDLGRANTLRGLGDMYRLQSEYTQAEESYTRAQGIYARIGDDLGRANAEHGLGHLRQQQGRNAEAALHFAEAKDLYAQIGSTDVDDEEDAARWLAVVSPEQDSSTP